VSVIGGASAPSAGAGRASDGGVPPSVSGTSVTSVPGGTQLAARQVRSGGQVGATGRQSRPRNTSSRQAWFATKRALTTCFSVSRPPALATTVAVNDPEGSPSGIRASLTGNVPTPTAKLRATSAPPPDLTLMSTVSSCAGMARSLSTCSRIRVSFCFSLLQAVAAAASRARVRSARSL
jgi:hypothetical protein